MTYGELWYKVKKPVKNGESRYDHLKAYEKQTGKRSEILEKIEEPSWDIQFFWELYSEVCRGRVANNPLSWQDIQAWMNVTKNNLTFIELRLLISLEDIYYKLNFVDAHE